MRSAPRTARRMFVHILPNVSHVILVQLSLHVVLFIKSEVILSFLGFGVGVDTVSWGSMLNEAQSELILGKWWQLAAATLAMAHARYRVQPLYRRVARRARSEAQERVTPCNATGKLHERRRDSARRAQPAGGFSRRRHDDPGGGQRHSFRHTGEQHRGAGRRVRQRQIRHRARDHGTSAEGKRARASRRPGAVPRPQPARSSRPRELRRCAAPKFR